MNQKILSILVLITTTLFLSSCSPLTIQFTTQPAHVEEKTPTATNTIENVINPAPTESPTGTLTHPTPSLTAGPPMLKLDGNYYCNVGPGANFNRVTIFPTGTELEIIGWNGGGWYLVKINLSGISRKQCWIGGGVPLGDLHVLPIPTAAPSVPAHDPTNWIHVALLTCPELSIYEWTWGGSSSGEYASLTPIIGIVNATIVYTEYHPICPGFTPLLKVPIHDLDSGGVIGYLSCGEVSSQGWYWLIAKGRWVSSTILFGSGKASYLPLEVSMNCPSMNPTKVVPVHGASWEFIGFLTCPELEAYTWNAGTNSGEYIASTILFGSNYATIYYEEYNPACPSFSP